MPSTVFLIPSLLADDAIASLSPAVLAAVQTCEIVFAENIRTTRRFFKSLDRSIDIDRYDWHAINPEEPHQSELFKRLLNEGKQIAIVSEAGCPGIADPGQHLVELAHRFSAKVKPISGPSALLLALMASGMNGQRFSFFGYLPIESTARNRALRNMETQSRKEGITCLFIETPYRNNALFQAITENCTESTRICVAADLTGAGEFICTRTVGEWKNHRLDLHKRPVVFLMQGG